MSLREVKRVETRSLLCELTPNELMRAGERLAEVQHELADVQLAEKRRREDFKEYVEGIEGRRDDLVTIVRRKSDYRDVQVQVVFDYGAGSVETVRTDTMEVIATRAMTQDERQMEMRLSEAPAH